MAQNEFAWRGALGGLVAADEQIQKEVNDRLENTRKAIENAANLLDLNLSRKYKERQTKATTEGLEYDARSKGSSARVAEETEDEKIRLAEAEAKDKETIAEGRKSLIDSEVEQRRSAAAASRANAAMTNTQREYYGELTRSELAERAARTAATYHSMGIEKARLELAAEKAEFDHSTQLQRLNMEEQRLAQELQQIQQGMRLAENKEARNQRIFEIQESLQQIKENKINSEIRLNQAKSRYYNYAAAGKLIGAGATSNPVADMSAEEFSRATGIENLYKEAGDAVRGLIDRNNNKWTTLDIDLEGDEGGFLTDEAANLYKRYQQLAQNGHAPIYNNTTLRSAVQHLLAYNHLDGSSVKPDMNIDQNYWSFVRGRLNQTRANPTDAVSLDALGGVIKESRERGQKVPIDLMFEWLVRSGAANNPELLPQ